MQPYGTFISPESTSSHNVTKYLFHSLLRLELCELFVHIFQYNTIECMDILCLVQPSNHVVNVPPIFIA
jgi:hypothetical protein